MASTLVAQQDSTSTTRVKKHKFWIGPKFGLDVSSTTTSLNEISQQLKGNYQAGILMQYGRTLFIQPEVYYASYKVDETTKQNYIKIPLMLGLKFLDLGLFSLHAMGGPSYSMLLDNKNHLAGANTLTWQLGVGVDLFGFITTDLRYTLNKKSIADQVSDVTKNPTMLNLTMGLKLR